MRVIDKETEERRAELERVRKAAEPLIKLLNEECHPHVTAIVTPTSVEILESVCSVVKIYDFIVE